MLTDEEISFEDLGLDERTLAAVERKGFKVPSSIQVLAIPRLLSGDANIIAKARTGTGKTAAFGLPIVQSIREQSDHVRALILEPTRELAIQTCSELKSFGEAEFPRVTVLYGGASYSTQIRDLKRGCEIVVGTPGRVQDHIDRGTLVLDKIDYFILDEGDEMLDMGFIEDIEAIFSSANPQSRILLFSATMPAEILKIAQKFMGEYEICEEEGYIEESLPIEQKYWIVAEREKIEALVRLIDIAPDFYGLVFTQTKNDADIVSRQLDERGYEAAALHGDIPQSQREKILSRFRLKKTRVLVATDVAARGIDITGLSHVVNYSLPFDGATYVHRIGRTGRAGSEGIAVTFVRPEERRRLEYLKRSARRASKGELHEEAIPSVQDVLNAKRDRLLENLMISLGLKQKPQVAAAASAESLDESPQSEAESPQVAAAASAEAQTESGQSEASLAQVTAAASAESLDESPQSEAESPQVTAASSAESLDESGQSEASLAQVAAAASAESQDESGQSGSSLAQVAAAAEAESQTESGQSEAAPVQVFVPSLKEAQAVYRKMAERLCEGRDPVSVLAAVLDVVYGKTLDASRYGKVTVYQQKSKAKGEGSSAKSKSAAAPNQKRIYVQLGRRDGFNARAIADYFSSLLKIPGRLVDKIDVSENFSLLSLPSANALRALELSKNSSVPHMHLDSKTESGFQAKNAKDFSARRGFDSSFPRFSDRDRYTFTRGKRSDRKSAFKSDHARPRVHTATERKGASAYKKTAFKHKNKDL